MPGTIGIDSTAGLGTASYSSTETHLATIDGAYTYTAVANDEITELGFHCGLSAGDGSGIEIGVLDITSGIANAPLVASATISSPTTSDRNVAALSASLTSGNTYAVVWRVASATNISLFRTFTSNATQRGTLDGTSALAANFTSAGTFSQRHAVFATVTTAASGPTVTTPTSGTDGTNVQFTGASLDTATGSSLKSGTVTKALNITAQTATTINLDLVSGADGLSLGVPVDGIPLNPTISAAGITPYTVNIEVTDGVTPNTLGFTLNAGASYDVLQTMIASANTTAAESIWGNVGGVQDNHLARVPKTVDSTTLTWSADGTFTANNNDTITFDVSIYAPDTEQYSLLRVTVSNGVIVDGISIKKLFRSTIKRSILQ